MEEEEGRYINPYTDYGFKYLFGTEPNKEFTLALVNALLKGKEVIKSLTLLPTEQLGDTKDDRRSVFDVYCENEKGDKIIIEMQKADQQYFKDRSIYYSSFPIRQQGIKGRWRFGLKAVYTIGILDFVFDEDKDDEEYYHHVVKLMDVEKKEVFYDNLTYIYLEMPKFRKTESELHTLFDKWLYALKNLSRLLERPAALQERVFKKFFKVAEIANLNKDDYAKYVESEKIYYDLDGAFRSAAHSGFKQGMKKGIAQGLEQGMAQGLEQGMAQGLEQGLEQGRMNEKRDTVRRLQQLGLSVGQIAQGIGMTEQEVQGLMQQTD